MKKERIQQYLSQYIFLFFLCAFIGWLWEILIFLIKDGSFHNRGFLYGPWLPVYGIGAVLFFILLHRFRKYPVFVFFLALLIGSGVEFFAGWLLKNIWQLRYWDYSNDFLNLYGYVCLYSALGFGVAGTIWICLASDIVLCLWNKISTLRQRKVNTFLILIFVIDCAAALIFPNAGHGITF